MGVGLRHFRSPASQREKQEVHFTALTAEEAGGRGARRVRSSRRPLNAAFKVEGWGVGGRSLQDDSKAVTSLFKCLKQTTERRAEQERPVPGRQNLLLLLRTWGGGGRSASADQESLSPFIKMFSFPFFFYSTSDRKSLIHSKREKKIKIEGNYTESAPCAC